MILSPFNCSVLLLGGWQGAAALASPAAPAVQSALLAMGLLGSWYLVHRLVTRHRAPAGGLVRLPAFLLVGFLAASYGLLFAG